VFPARYELNSYIVYRKRLVSKRLNLNIHGGTDYRLSVFNQIIRFSVTLRIICGNEKRYKSTLDKNVRGLKANCLTSSEREGYRLSGVDGK
jgi:hypothetical protein